MAHYKRHRPRTSGTHNVRSMSHWPRWWDVVHHTRPRRRAETRLLSAVLRDVVDPDDLAWPVGNHKPHQYYW